MTESACRVHEITTNEGPMFYAPSVRAAQLRPRGRNVLVRPEPPPDKATLLWTPHHREKEGRAVGFVVYGRVIRVGPGDYEPGWVTDVKTGERVRDGQATQDRPRRFKVRVKGNKGDEVQERVDLRKLVFVPTEVREGERVFWAHGWGPRIELEDGSHYLIHELGVLGRWTPEHVCCWHYAVGRLGVEDRVKCCECGRLSWIETRLPSCGPFALGPRVQEAIIGHDPTRIETIDTSGLPSDDDEEDATAYVVNEGEDA